MDGEVEPVQQEDQATGARRTATISRIWRAFLQSYDFSMVLYINANESARH